MAVFEYKVVPAPERGTKAKGVKTPEARFALSLEELMNELGADGWQYLRADTLPATERSGLTGSTTNWRHVLVFQRPIEVAQPAEIPDKKENVAHDPDRPGGQPGATQMLKDNGVEETSEVSGVTSSLKTLAATRTPPEKPEKSDV